MCSIPEVATAMQHVLTSSARTAGNSSRFVQRHSAHSHLDGATFVQALVFGWLAQPQASLHELSQTAAALGVHITPQGLAQRFTPQAATCLEQVLQAAVGRLLQAEPVPVALLRRFNGVYVQDSTTIALPDALQEVWQGCGGGSRPSNTPQPSNTPLRGRTPSQGRAAVKLQVRLDLCRGTLHGPLLHDGRANDHRGWVRQDQANQPNQPNQPNRLPAGSLRVADLGFFSLDEFQALHKQHVFWLSRVPAGLQLWDRKGRCWEVLRFLQRLQRHSPDKVSQWDVAVQLGQRARVPCRLLAVRVAAPVAAQRRAALRKEAAHRGRRVSAERSALCDWIILVTNVPTSGAVTLSLAEALVLYRARWQIERLFRLWKEVGQADQWRSEKPWAVLCEVYAKLLGCLVQHWLLQHWLLQHWLLLVGAWADPARSWHVGIKRPKSQVVHKQAWHLLCNLRYDKLLKLLYQALSDVVRCMRCGCRVEQRNKAPATFQLLLDCSARALT